ncbi:ribonuclease Z [Evansella halocellulosilytica]|uniref:ribonuclease Z n=1 Tax=Evansella halocellulosilytica TaxID=2011013 RepID=UPI000BB99929|nr:ribonuclease Z [Evansella halocellulosilytica]
MKVTFLGTCAGVPAKHRNVSSLALHLENKKNTTWLFDCGEATQHQILYTSIKLRKIEKIFITHLHGDHIFGLPGLLGSRSFQGAESTLTIYGPTGLKDFVDTALKVSGTYLKYPLEMIEHDEEGTLFHDSNWRVKTAPLIHGLPCYGYRIEQKDLPGPLLMDKVHEYGIPEGPILKQLKNGERVQLANGTVVNGEDFIGPPKKGKVVAVLGDTRYSENAIKLAKGADTLIHEATFAAGEENLAKEYFHSTTLQAADIAQKAGANQLILNHISSRYQKDESENLASQAKRVFSNTYIAEDLSHFQI